MTDVLKKPSPGIFLFLFLAIGIWINGCEEPNTNSTRETQLTNTLGETTVGNGTEGLLIDYFYGLDNDIYAEFYRFSMSQFEFSYSSYLSLQHRPPPLLTLQTFPEYLVEITPDKPESTKRTLIDSLTQQGTVLMDSVLLTSTMFKNIESFFWDLDANPDNQRYKPNNSDWIFSTIKVAYNDTVDQIAYAAVVDTPLIDEGVLFVDKAEWKDTTFQFVADEPVLFQEVFTFERKQIGPDSLMYRINTDCNDNGVWDPAETVDVGNGIWDPDEPYYDIDGDGARDLDEPFEDRNCNGVWDPAETLTLDQNENGKWDPGDQFNDRGNGIIDPEEAYTDRNHNGIPEPDELYLKGTVPKHLLVTWSDSLTSQVMMTIYPGDSLVSRWGIVYHDLLEVATYNDTQIVEVNNVDSLVTLYTNEVIARLPSEDKLQDYLITKTEWENTNPGPGEEAREYDYLLFKFDDHLYKVAQPSYFKPYGYYWTESQVEDGFWYKPNFEEEVLYYTSNGLLRDGEMVEEEYFDTTAVAIYKIEKSYQVAADAVEVPAKKVRGYVDNNGDVICYADETWPAATVEDCPGADTTFTNCFRITREMTMTLVGSGVEYGERNITWLVKGLGIAKDEVYVRWSEFPGQPETWIGFSRWELGKFTSSPLGRSRTLGKLMQDAQVVKLHELDQVAEFHNDPYRTRRTAGLQRVYLP